MVVHLASTVGWDGVTSTPYRVDDAAGATDFVWPPGAVRVDKVAGILPTLTPANGDYVNLRTNELGALQVELVSLLGRSLAVNNLGGTDILNVELQDASSGGVANISIGGELSVGTFAFADNVATPAETVFPAGVVRDDALATLVQADGDWTYLRTNSRGAQWVQHDGAVTVTTDFNEDEASGTGYAVFPAGAILDSSLTALTVAEGDWTGVRVDGLGRLWCRVDNDITVQSLHNIGDTVPLSPNVFPGAMERDDVLSTVSEPEGDWTLYRATSLGELWTTATLRLQQTEVVAAAGIGVSRTTRLPVQNYGLNALPQLTFSLGTAETFGTSLVDPSAVQAAGVNAAMGGQAGTGGGLRTGPDRDTVVSLFSAQVFNNTTTSANSSAVDVSGARWAVIYIDLAESGNPTDIRLIPQFSNDGGTTWFDWSVDQWVDLRYVDAQMPLTESIPLNYVIGTDFRLRAVATGTTASDTFTLSADIEVVS